MFNIFLVANSNKWRSIEWDEPDNKQLFKPTIINLSENGTTIKNNGTEEALDCGENFNSKIVNGNNVQQHEMKTVVVEVHRSDIEEKTKTENEHNALAKSSSTSSFGSLISNTSSSFSSAICQEIMRRSQVKGL